MPDSPPLRLPGAHVKAAVGYTRMMSTQLGPLFTRPTAERDRLL